ncbi:hypothetical protein MHF_1061 [Mycoplasma haemofelis Ohio2]|uniref:Uncharacterized protein n=1 Tax=Mycoplasma haemofelis (strain Ohio2) TaxID=859194 RepID=F6FJF6_MYCHI|nr:hypothetical protein MHF_1061 [Mycoplasma haemofelis Ohio2]
MSKSLALSLGGLGVAGSGVGGLLVFKPWEPKAITFADKYKHAFLDTSKNDTSWDSKYAALKTHSLKKRPSLVKASEEANKGSSANEAEARRLMREGCKAIYESPFENSEYEGDFKTFCSKTNEEASDSKKSWNNGSASEATSNKWDTPLNSLKSHDMEKQGGLVDVLAQLKATLSTGSALSQEHRESLKKWCDSIRKEPFMGTDSLEFKNQELYCKTS